MKKSLRSPPCPPWSTSVSGSIIPRMDRRSLLKFGGMASIGFALEGCASTTTAAKPQLAPRRPAACLPVVNAAWDRVIRTTIGLRPHRPSGFVLQGRQARRQDAHPQLRPRRLRHVAVVGHGVDGHRPRDAAYRAQGRGARIRRRRSDVGARAAAARLRRHDLRGDGAARHDLEHVAGRVDADVGSRR